MGGIIMVLKSKKLWGWVIGIIVILVLVAVVSYNMGSTSATVVIDDEKVTYEEILSEIEAAQAELKDNNEKVTTSEEAVQKEQDKLDDKEKEVEEALALVENHEELEEDVEKLTKEEKNLKTEKENLASDIKALEKERDELENVITKKQEEPIELIAGVYLVGYDVPEGRYQVTNIGRGTNFFVRGSTRVNTILGEDHGRGDYVFFTSDGDEIETAGPVKLIPVE